MRAGADGASGPDLGPVGHEILIGIVDGDAEEPVEIGGVRDLQRGVRPGKEYGIDAKRTDRLEDGQQFVTAGGIDASLLRRLTRCDSVQD